MTCQLAARACSMPRVQEHKVLNIAMPQPHAAPPSRGNTYPLPPAARRCQSASGNRLHCARHTTARRPSSTTCSRPGPPPRWRRQSALPLSRCPAATGPHPLAQALPRTAMYRRRRTRPQAANCTSRPPGCRIPHVQRQGGAPDARRPRQRRRAEGGACRPARYPLAAIAPASAPAAKSTPQGATRQLPTATEEPRARLCCGCVGGAREQEEAVQQPLSWWPGLEFRMPFACMRSPEQQVGYDGRRSWRIALLLMYRVAGWEGLVLRGQILAGLCVLGCDRIPSGEPV